MKPKTSVNNFVHPFGCVLFVSDDVSKGKSWGTYYLKPDGSLVRHQLPDLPLRKSRSDAQVDLELYAQIHRLPRETHP